MTSAVSVDTTSAVMSEVAALRPWFTPPGEVRVESITAACALAGACYALPGYAREVDRSGRPRWWPFTTGYLRTQDRRGELLVAVGFLLAAHRTELPDEDEDEASQADELTVVERLRRGLVGPCPGDPGRSTRASAVDALGFAAACYALPPFARQPGIRSVPLLWPWPARLWLPTTRGQELLTAAAMLVAELERHPESTPRPVRPALTMVPGGAA